MIKYIIEGKGIKEVLDKTEDVLDILVKFKNKHPSLQYDISLESPLGDDMVWTIKLDINDGELKDKVFRKGIKAH